MGFWDVMSAIGSIILIVAVLVFTYLLTRWYARRMKAAGVGRHIRIVERTTLTGGVSLAIVEVQGKHLLLGTSEKNVQLLCELDSFTPEAAPEQQSAIPFDRILSQWMGKAKEPLRKQEDGASHEK